MSLVQSGDGDNQEKKMKWRFESEGRMKTVREK